MRRFLSPTLILSAMGLFLLFRHIFCPFDLVILNGRVIDPETGLDATVNIGIKGEKIRSITKEKIHGRQTIDAEGLVVSPGFIDVGVAGRPENYQDVKNIEYWKVTDGVTTALYLHDGTGNIAPYKKLLRKRGHYVNYGFSTRVVGYQMKDWGQAFLISF